MPEEPIAFFSTGQLLAAGREKREYRCRLVRAGRIKGAGNRESNIEITAQALQTAVAAGMFESRAVFVDHAGWSGGICHAHPSLRNLAGVTYDAQWNKTEQAVEGTVRLYSDAASIAELLDEILEDSRAKPDIGLSMVFWPVWEPRDNDGKNSRPEDLRRIVAVRYIESIDLVFQPAADGRILEALSCFNVSGGVRMEPEEGEGKGPVAPAGPVNTTGPVKTTRPVQVPGPVEAAMGGAAAVPGAGLRPADATWSPATGSPVTGSPVTGHRPQAQARRPTRPKRGWRQCRAPRLSPSWRPPACRQLHASGWLRSTTRRRPR